MTLAAPKPTAVRTPLVVVTDQTFGGIPHAESMADRLGVRLNAHQVHREDETAAIVDGADVVLVQYAPITRTVLQHSDREHA